MIEIWFRPYGFESSKYENGAINYRHTEKHQYLGIGQQLFAQMMGWA